MGDTICHIPLLPGGVCFEGGKECSKHTPGANWPVTVVDKVNVLGARTLLDTNKWYSMQ